MNIITAKEAREITNNYIPEETSQIIKEIGQEIINLSNDGNSVLLISETSDVWFQYFDNFTKKYFEKLGYKVSYQYGGIDGDYWIISW